MVELLLSRVHLFFGLEAKVGNGHIEFHLPLDLCGAQCGVPHDSNCATIFCMNSPVFQSKMFTIRLVFAWHATKKFFMHSTEKHAEIFEVANPL